MLCQCTDLSPVLRTPQASVSFIVITSLMTNAESSKPLFAMYEASANSLELMKFSRSLKAGGRSNATSFIFLSTTDSRMSSRMRCQCYANTGCLPPSLSRPPSFRRQQNRSRSTVAATTNYPSVIEIATWDDLEKACAAGLEIGSHTRTHVRLSEVSRSKAAIEDEIFGSKADLERRLGRDCHYISWPYGRTTDADAQSLQTVEKAGYRACFGAFRGRVIPKITDRFRIPRHHFEVQWPLSHVKCFAHGAMER